MKKMYFLLVVAIGFGFSSFSQIDANAKKILDAVGAKVKSSKGITASFTLSTASGKGKDKGTKTGRLSVKGNKYILNQGKTEIICDGSKVYNYDGSSQITVSSVEEGGKGLNPLKLLEGTYDNDFIYSLISSKGTVYQIEMKPKDNKKNFRKVNLFIDKSKNMLSKAVILDKSNNTTQLSITNLNDKAVLNDNIFIFNKAKYPPDTEILD